MTEEQPCTLVKTDEFQSEFTFTLRKPIPWINQSNHGTEEFASELLLKAPSNRQRRQTAALSQGFLRAIHYGQQSAQAQKHIEDVNFRSKNTNNTGDKDKILTGAEILSAVMLSDVDYVTYQEIFRTLLLAGVASVSDGQKLTPAMYDDMSAEDSQNLMGEYIAIFLISSLMKNLQ